MSNIVFLPPPVLYEKNKIYHQKIARQILIQWYERRMGSISFLSLDDIRMKKSIKVLQETLFFSDSVFLQDEKKLFKWSPVYQNMFDTIVSTIEKADTTIILLTEDYYYLLQDVIHEYLQFTGELKFLSELKVMYLLKGNFVTPLIPTVSLVA